MRNYSVMDFTVPEDLRVKIKVSEKIDKYLNLARDMKSQRNIRLTVISNVISAIGTDQKDLEEILKEV